MSSREESQQGEETPISSARLRTAERRLGYSFKNPRLLAQAFCHASTRNEGFPSNERLEFLGDSVLSLVVATHLFKEMKDADEGTLSHYRALMTQGQHLANVASKLGLGELLRTGKGQDLEPTPNMAGDAVEACIGAIFLDGGMREARRFIRKHVITNFELEAAPFDDPKSKLQHYTLEKRLGLPEYELVKTTGPGHALSFVMEVKVAGRVLGCGSGSSKKTAARNAASEALTALLSTDEDADLQPVAAGDAGTKKSARKAKKPRRPLG
ncbi:MAG: ribonuclease III [Planctomycetota bacterium]